ncbi:hypothetical protein [Metabacillus fastidiosus]|uniref:hypothetical protein n=1 Tax=Metabacillus fastidiosus TaxID=1458 RepID=UPI003D2739CF
MEQITKNIYFPMKVTETDIKFGRIDGILPKIDEIPEEFFQEDNKWNKIISK